jgi:Flp pilus assembly protein TadD
MQTNLVAKEKRHSDSLVVQANEAIKKFESCRIVCAKLLQVRNLIQQAKTYISLGAEDEAVKVLGNALKADPDNMEARNLLQQIKNKTN